jgi:DNA-binding transcriptional regulator YdaS (Cro superfamily)
MKADSFKNQQIVYLRKLSAFFDYNRAELAKAFGVDTGLVHMWFMRGRISAKKAILAERITDGKITKKMLRPDVKDWMDEPR